MVEAMKKLSLLVFYQDKAEFLDKLQELGVVHLEVAGDVSSPELERFMEAKSVEVKALNIIKRYYDKKKPLSGDFSQTENAELRNRILELDRRIEDADLELTEREKERRLLEPWGRFEWESVDRLHKAGVRVRFFHAHNRYFKQFDLSDIYYTVILDDGRDTYFAVFERENEPVELENAERFNLPRKSLTTVREEIRTLDKQKADCAEQLHQLYAVRDRLQSEIATLDTKIAYERARAGMTDMGQGKICAIIGWVPQKVTEQTRTFLNEHGAAYFLEDPAPEDRIPVKLKNGPFAKPFEIITGLRSFPDYFELDPTPFFAPFFAFFFGMCFGDMGYGLILTAISVVLLFVLPRRFKIAARMGLFLGLATTVAGLLLNTFFGASLFALPGADMALMSEHTHLAALGAVEKKDGTYFAAIPFSIYLGIVQIMLGMVIQAVNRARLKGVVWGVQPIATLIMTAGAAVFLVKLDFMDLGTYQFGALKLGALIGQAPPNTEFILMGAGLFFLILFNNPDKNIFARFGLGIWELYQFLTGLMGDGLSYLRLFALGLAGGLLGYAFNMMAFMIITRDGVVNWATPLAVFTVLILVFGHALNFALAILGAFVHSLRLTFVEFYKNVDFQGGATPYTPFAKLK